MIWACGIQEINLQLYQGKLLKVFLEKSPNVHLKIMKLMLFEDCFGDAAFFRVQNYRPLKSLLN